MVHCKWLNCKLNRLDNLRRLRCWLEVEYLTLNPCVYLLCSKDLAHRRVIYRAQLDAHHLTSGRAAQQSVFPTIFMAHLREDTEYTALDSHAHITLLQVVARIELTKHIQRLLQHLVTTFRIPRLKHLKCHLLHRATIHLFFDFIHIL